MIYPHPTMQVPPGILNRDWEPDASGLLLPKPKPLLAAQSVINVTASAGTGSTTTCAFTIPGTNRASVLILGIGSQSFGVSGVSCGGGSWSLAEPAANSHNIGEVWIGEGVAEGTTSGTITFAGTTNSAVQSLEITGTTTAPTDTKTNAGGASTAVSAGPVTPSTPLNVVIGLSVTNTAPTAGPSGSFTGLTPLVFALSRTVQMAYKIQTAATAATVGWTIVSGNWDAAIVCFKGQAEVPFPYIHGGYYGG